MQSRDLLNQNQQNINQIMMHNNQNSVYNQILTNQLSNQNIKIEKTSKK